MPIVWRHLCKLFLPHILLIFRLFQTCPRWAPRSTYRVHSYAVNLGFINYLPLDWAVRLSQLNVAFYILSTTYCRGGMSMSCFYHHWASTLSSRLDRAFSSTDIPLSLFTCVNIWKSMQFLATVIIHEMISNISRVKLAEWLSDSWRHSYWREACQGGGQRCWVKTLLTKWGI